MNMNRISSGLLRAAKLAAPRSTVVVPRAFFATSSTSSPATPAATAAADEDPVKQAVMKMRFYLYFMPHIDCL
jgi:hypothetical protein